VRLGHVGGELRVGAGHVALLIGRQRVAGDQRLRAGRVQHRDVAGRVARRLDALEVEDRLAVVDGGQLAGGVDRLEVAAPGVGPGAVGQPEHRRRGRGGGGSR
jgi:hypothetical protein